MKPTLFANRKLNTCLAATCLLFPLTVFAQPAGGPAPGQDMQNGPAPGQAGGPPGGFGQGGPQFGQGDGPPRGGFGGQNLDPDMVFTRPTSSPGLGTPMKELPAPDADGFISMFNGKDLTGWDALPNFWSVKDGVIDVVQTSEEGGNIQSNLSWIDSIENPEKYDNFELHIQYRWVSNGGNSGLQFRSIMDNTETKHLAGYQADFDPQNSFSGALFNEGNGAGRHQSGAGPHMAPRGYKTTYPADGGDPTLEPLAEDAETLATYVNPVGEFNELVVITDGPHTIIKVNGHVFAEVVDLYPNVPMSGMIGIQQHAGAQMQLQIKDPKIKFLTASD